MRGLGTYYDGDITDTSLTTDFAGHTDTSKAIPVDAPPASPADGLNPLLIPDGFAYNVHLKYLPYRANPMQMRMLTDYRRQALAGMWQPRHVSVPVDTGVPIAAGDTLNFEGRVARGSVLWGYTFAVIGGGTVADMRISMMDGCNQHQLTAGAKDNQYIIGSAFRANFTSGTPSAGFPFVFMPAPYPMSGGAPMIQVNIVNTVVSASRTCQLVLMFLEPGGSPR